MATVKTQDLQLPTGRFKLQVKCDSSGEFSAAYPPEMVRMLGKSKATGKSLKECETDFWAGVQDFKTANRKTRKVIAYRIETEGRSFRSGIGCNLTAQVYEEEFIEVDGQDPRKEYTELENSLPDEMTTLGMGESNYSYPQRAKIIDWTEEREAFFKHLGESLLAVINAVAEIRNTEKLLELVDSGSKLTLVTKDGKTEGVKLLGGKAR